MDSKRSRSSNWSESEKSLLTGLIKEKIHLIENKDVSKNNNQMKKAAWQEILQSFNQMNENKRDLVQLVNQWRNTKNNIKKRDFTYRRQCNATGGGPRPPSPPPEDVEIIQMIPNEFEVDENVFDSDSLNIKKDHVIVIKPDLNQPGCSSSSLLLPTETVQMPDSEVAVEQPKIRNIKKIKKKVIPNSSSEQKELFLLAKSAREKQIQNQDAEHRRKLEILETEHKMRLEIMKKELEYWGKKLAE